VALRLGPVAAVTLAGNSDKSVAAGPRPETLKRVLHRLSLFGTCCRGRPPEGGPVTMFFKFRSPGQLAQLCSFLVLSSYPRVDENRFHSKS
jgi:hypothetical protein